jgi:hypothetical protein
MSQQLKRLEAQFNKKLAQIQGATKEAFTDIILDLTGKAILLAPVDTGDLRGSGKGTINQVEVIHGEPREKNKAGTVEIGGTVPPAERYEGTVSFGTPYAHYQHEGLEFNHPQGGQAKYLEQPFVENMEKYINHLRDSVKKEVK